MKTFGTWSWMNLSVALLMVSLCTSCAAQAEDAPASKPAADAASAADAPTDEVITIAEGTVTLPMPAGWIRKQPRNNITEHEFEIPAAEGDELAGRATFTNAGGTVDANIERWTGQFSQPDGSSTAEKTKVTDMNVADHALKMVEITGTYADKAGPFMAGPGTPRENYELLAAVVPTKKGGNYYVKFYGPAKTVQAHKAGFVKMLEGLKAK